MMHKTHTRVYFAVLALATATQQKPWLTPKRLMLATALFRFDRPLAHTAEI